MSPTGAAKTLGNLHLSALDTSARKRPPKRSLDEAPFGLTLLEEPIRTGFGFGF